MRVKPRALGVYTPARFNEPMNPFARSAQGLRAYVAAAFDEPMNPFSGGMGVYPPSSFNEPQNPFGGMGCCGRRGGMGQTSGDTVLGGVDLTQIGTSISSAFSSLSGYTVAGIPVLYLAGGVAALALLLQSNSTGSLQKRASKYSAKASYLKSRVRARTAE